MNTNYSRFSGNHLLWGATLLLGFVSLILILIRVNTYLKNTAIKDCATISQFNQTVDDQRKVVYPLQDVYEACLKKKGL